MITIDTSRAAFHHWLTGLAPGTLAGYMDGGCRCPVAAWLGSQAPGDWRVGWSRARDRNDDWNRLFELPWAQPFIRQLTHRFLPNDPVNREQALELYREAYGEEDDERSPVA